MKRQKHAEYLQSLWDKSTDLMEATIEFKPLQGWFAVPFEIRYFGDEGEHLGGNWRQAESTILFLQGREKDVPALRHLRTTTATHPDGGAS